MCDVKDYSSKFPACSLTADFYIALTQRGGGRQLLVRLNTEFALKIINVHVQWVYVCSMFFFFYILCWMSLNATPCWLCESVFTPVYLASEDREGQSAGLAELSSAPWAGRRVGGVPSAGGEAEGPRPCSKPRLLRPHRARAHHLVQQPAAWRPHGRCPCLQSAHTQRHTTFISHRRFVDLLNYTSGIIRDRRVTFLPFFILFTALRLENHLNPSSLTAPCVFCISFFLLLLETKSCFCLVEYSNPELCIFYCCTAPSNGNNLHDLWLDKRKFVYIIVIVYVR